jgi:hypothetical protein
MGNLKASSVTPLPAVEIPGLVESGSEQTREFHFAVTWITLFAHLDPILSTGPRPRVETVSPSLALVPVQAPAPLAEQRSETDSSAAWEMAREPSSLKRESFYDQAVQHHRDLA